jgi:hypothetical protein
VLVIVSGSIPSLKVTPTLVLIGTSVARLLLIVPVTVGAVVSGIATSLPRMGSLSPQPDIKMANTIVMNHCSGLVVLLNWVIINPSKF